MFKNYIMAPMTKARGAAANAKSKKRKGPDFQAPPRPGSFTPEGSAQETLSAAGAGTPLRSAGGDPPRGGAGKGKKGNGGKAGPARKEAGAENGEKKGAGEKEESSREKKPVSFAYHLLEYAKAILLAVILALFIRSFVVQAFHIPSGSMIPTFLEGDRVLVTKFSYGVRNPFNNKLIFGDGVPKRGDVVIFKYPKDPNMDFVKRVVGLPGEEVEIRDGRIYINNALLPDPHGHYDGSAYTPSRNYGPVTVPENQYFMMGDNRDFSNDSRAWGFVDGSLLRGKAWRLYWSWDSDEGLSFFDRLRYSRLGRKVI
jgi:signal peptidase I